MRGRNGISDLSDMQPAVRTPTQKRLNLLLVEDNAADRLLLQSAFREVGVNCRWRVIDHGAEAMRIGSSTLKGFQPDLILLDWQLPGATGLEVLATFKQNPEWVSTPVVMFTGMQSASHSDSAKTAGACDVLEKPIDLDDWLKIPTRIETALLAA